jgi:drug/metabolite transporter (DMT)-like permease
MSEQINAVIIENKGKSLAQIGELWAMGGVLGYATATVVERTAMVHADPLIGPLIRGMPSLILGLVLMTSRGTYKQLMPRAPEYIGRRGIMVFIIPGVLATLGLFAYFIALQKGGVAITVPIQQSYIVWGVIFSSIYLGERLNMLSLSGVAILVIGLIILGLGQLKGTPVSSQWYYAIPLALFAAITFGVSGVFWREGQLLGADQSTGIFVNTATSRVMALGGLIIFGRFHALFETSARDLGALFVGGLLSGVVGLYCIFTSLRLMSVTRAYAFSSLTPLVAAFMAYVFLKEDINWQMMLGIVMVCVGVAIVQIFKSAESGE